LHTESTPTKDTASASVALTDSARSFAKLITELPTAARKEMQIKQDKLDTVLRNIDRYDGTSRGQEDVG
jgi:hypothetical protein